MRAAWQSAAPILLALSLATTATGGSPEAAAEPTYLLCPLVLHEEGVELEDLALEAQIAEIDLAANEEVFALLDSLLKNNAVERMLHLKWKRNRDAARVELDRRNLIVKRQKALLEQYEIVCGAPPGGALSDDRRRAVRAAHQRYRQADCSAIEASAAIAGIDLAYQQELLKSMTDLRASSVATDLDIILAEAQVRSARQRMDDGRQRADHCRREIGPAAGTEP